MEISGRHHASATLPPGKDPPGTHWVGGWVGPTASLNAVERRKISCPCREWDPGLPARRYTDRAIMAPDDDTLRSESITYVTVSPPTSEYDWSLS
jgi:hypothetical protein